MLLMQKSVKVKILVSMTRLCFCAGSLTESISIPFVTFDFFLMFTVFKNRHFLDHQKVKKDFQYIKNDSRIEKRLHTLLRQNSSVCPKKLEKFFPQ